MEQFQSIISELERQRSAVDNAISALRTVSAQSASTPKRLGRPVGSRNRTRRGPISDEGRQRQVEAMRRYWAAKRAGKEYSSVRAKA